MKHKHPPRSQRFNPFTRPRPELVAELSRVFSSLVFADVSGMSFEALYRLVYKSCCANGLFVTATAIVEAIDATPLEEWTGHVVPWSTVKAICSYIARCGCISEVHEAYSRKVKSLHASRVLAQALPVELSIEIIRCT